MSTNTPIEKANILLEKQTPLTDEDKKLFAYFGVNAKLIPPYRILNPQNIIIGDVTAISEGCHINAFLDLTFLMTYTDAKYSQTFERPDHIYHSRIHIGRDHQIGRCAL